MATSDEIIVKLVEQESSNKILEFWGLGGATLIASLLTVIATLVAVKCTNNNNKKIEYSKIKIEKLEEIHGLVYHSGAIFYLKRDIAVASDLKNLKKYYSEFYKSKCRIEILVNSYFKKSLLKASNEYLNSLDLVFNALKLKFEEEINDSLYIDIVQAQGMLSFVSDEYDELTNYDLENEMGNPVIEEVLIKNSEVKSADRELNEIVAESEWHKKKFNKIKEELKNRKNPSINSLIDEMLNSRETLLAEIIKQAQKNIN
ncbi:hypothetical protein ABFY60_27505 [Lysinibacillus pakistanensis]|uniref:hypothetical protein n=1 Tax=Lysinibacillus pakistanensis TaxID=759811 RepID=UPI003D2DAAAE